MRPDSFSKNSLSRTSKTIEPLIATQVGPKLLCGLWAEDETVSEVEKEKEWRPKSSLLRHQDGQFHVAQICWYRQMSHDYPDGEFRCPCLGCPTKDTVYADIQYLEEHILRAARSIQKDQHARDMRETYRLEDENFRVKDAFGEITKEERVRGREKSQERHKVGATGCFECLSDLIHHQKILDFHGDAAKEDMKIALMQMKEDRMIDFGDVAPVHCKTDGTPSKHNEISENDFPAPLP
jgi:hypothetical protein